MAEPMCFMDRVVAGTSRDLLYDCAHFIRMLAYRLGRDRLRIGVRPGDVTDYFGNDVSFLRIAIALSQMTRHRLTFEKNGRYRDCPLLGSVDHHVKDQVIHVCFTREGRDLLQDPGWEWTLQMAPDSG